VKVETKAIKSVEITLTLTANEATVLKGMMQNPLSDPESETEGSVRETLFITLCDAGF